MGLKIGYHAWEPGLQGRYFTSAGGAAWTSFLFKKLKDQGHKIMWFGSSPAPKKTIMAPSTAAVAQCDVLVCCWRWFTDEAERQAAYTRQNELLAVAAKAKVPVLIHDQDYKISFDDLEYIKENEHFTIARPELFPLDGTKSLIFPNPYDLSERLLGPTQEHDLIYVGNNYERWAQTLDYIKPFQRDKDVVLYGNWLERSPLRESPEVVLKALPHTTFPGRLEQDKIINVLRSGNSTIHMFKKEYGKTGFMTIRWAEAAKAGIPAFIPAGFSLPEKWGYAFNSLGLIVNSGEKLIQNYEALISDPTKWTNAVDMQREFVLETMDWHRWEEILTKIANGGLL